MAIYTNRKNWLGSEEGIVTKTFEVPAATAYVVENERNIVKSGTYFASPFKGLLFEDVDITDGAAFGSLMISGYYIDANLPATVASHVTDFQNQGLYAVAEDSITRPSFGDNLLTALSTPAPAAVIANSAIEWADVSYDIGYYIYKDGVLVAENNSATLAYTPTAPGSFQVQAKATNLDYRHSDLSNAVVVSPVVLVMPTNAAANDTTDILSWTAVTGAESYNIYKAGTVVASTANASINVAAYGTSNAYKIEAVGDGIWYTNSPLTAALSVTV